jgi:hypothetical protein
MTPDAIAAAFLRVRAEIRDSLSPRSQVIASDGLDMAIRAVAEVLHEDDPTFDCDAFVEKCR